MKHAILLMWHKNFKQLKELIEFFDDDFCFYVHIDCKSALDRQQLEWLNNNAFVKSVYKKFKITWGGFNLLKAELFLIKQAVANKEVDYIHVMSAQDYPIRNLKFIKTVFEREVGTEFLSYHRIPFIGWDRGTYNRFDYYRPYDFCANFSSFGDKLIQLIERFQVTCKLKRRIPDQYDYLYGGSNWMSITRKCAEYVVSEYNHNFFRRLRWTFGPEETFFPTVILNSPFALNVKNNNLRYIVWHKTHDGHPKILDQTDWGGIITCNALFARKFEDGKSDFLKSCLRRYLFREETYIGGTNGAWLTESLSDHWYDASLGKALLDILPYTGANDIADFGCGPGWYTYLLRTHGYCVNGYDGNPNVKEMSSLLFQDGFFCQHVDLTKKLEIDIPFDMIICLEVGEHIPAKYENTFLLNLVRNSNMYILLSWALPKQKGCGHVNCHSNKYIIDKMKAYGFYINTPITNYLREKASLKWFHKTIMFFQKSID